MAAKPVSPADPRAVEHGLLVKERRLDLGLNRPAFVAQMEKHGQEITPDYLNKLERGTAPLSRASLEVREAIRAVLGYSTEKWQELTGLYTPDIAPEPTPRPRLRPIPAELQEMIDEKSALVPELAEERWQQYLAGQRFSTGRASAERWWNLYLVVKNAGIEPGGN